MPMECCSKIIKLSIELARQLKVYSKKSMAAKELLDLVLDHIEAYEKNIYPLKKSKPEEILAFLMEQHGLTQSELPEIGSQSHVSKVLNGKRQLTRQQISALSKKFNVSPAIWYS
jgi:HTH-type transcriptional regulator / antitoxin HigA